MDSPKEKNHPPPPLYNSGDFVWIDQIYVVETSLLIKKLEKPIVARVSKRKDRTPSFGWAYYLIIPPKFKPENHANACYWEDDILGIAEDPDELIWKIWGDQ